MTISRVNKRSFILILFCLILLVNAAFPQIQNWQKEELSRTPSNRYEHAMIFDTVRNVAILFGGYTTSGRVYDTWEFDGAWKNIETVNSPTASGPGCLAFDASRNVTVYFGGYNGLTYQNSTWEYSGNNWTEITTDHSPSKRYAASLVYDSDRKKIILFGGFGYSEANPNFLQLLNDTWEYDGNDWTKITTSATPPARSHHAMVYDTKNKKVILFGGKNVDNKLYEYDGSDWKEIIPSNSASEIPLSRYSHSMVYDIFHAKMILYGGYNSGIYYDETYEFYNNTWQKINPLNTPNYPFQGGMIWNADNKRVYYFGGKNATSTSNETWFYSEDPYPSGTILFNKETYFGLIDQANIIVADYNVANDPLIKDTVVVRVKSDKDINGFEVTLKETKESNGIFSSKSNDQNLFFTTLDSDPIHKIIKVADKSTITVEYFYAYKSIIIADTASWNKHADEDIITFNTDSYLGLDKNAIINVFDQNRPNDPTLPEVVKVKITSDDDTKGFEIDLKEVGNFDGIFSTDSAGKNLTFTIGQSEDPNKRIKVSHGKKIKADYNYLYDNKTVSAEATWYGRPATIKFDSPVYINLDAKANIEVNEPEKNLDPNLQESAVCHIKSDIDPSGFYVTLWETGPNTSIFSTATFDTPIKFSGGYSDPINYKLRVQTNSVITASFADFYPPEIVTATAVWKQKSTSWLAFDKTTLVNEYNINVTLISNELNINSDFKDKTQLYVRSTTDEIGIIIEAEETSTNSGVFKNTFHLSESTYSSGSPALLAASDTIFVKDGDDVIAETAPNSPFFASPLKAMATFIRYELQKDEPKMYIVDGPEDNSIYETNSNLYFRLTGLIFVQGSGHSEPTVMSSDNIDYEVKLMGYDKTWIPIAKRYIDASGNITTVKEEAQYPLITGEKVIYPNVPDGKYTFYVRSIDNQTGKKSYHKERSFLVKGNPAAPLFKAPVLNAYMTNDALIRIKWSEVEGATGYYLYRRDVNSGPYILLNDQSTTETQFVDGRDNSPDKYPVFGTTYEYFVSAEEIDSGAIVPSNFVTLLYIQSETEDTIIGVDKANIDFGTYGTETEISLSDQSPTKIKNIKWSLTTDCPYISFDKNYGQLQFNLPEKIKVRLDRRFIPPGLHTNFSIYLKSDAYYISPDILGARTINLRFAIPGPVLFNGMSIPYLSCGRPDFPYWGDFKLTSIYNILNISHQIPEWGSGNAVIDYNEQVFHFVSIKNTGNIGASSTSVIMYEEDEHIMEYQTYYLKYNEVPPLSGATGSDGFTFQTSDKVPELRNGYQTNVFFLAVDNDLYQWTSFTPVVVYRTEPIQITQFDIDDDNIGGSMGNSNELIDPGEMIETRSTIYNQSLYPFSQVSVKLNSQATNCIENYNYCAWDDLVGTNRYRFRDIFFTSNYPSLWTRVDFGLREGSFLQDGYLQSKQSYSLVSDNQDIEFRTFSVWIPAPYNFYEVPAGSDGGGRIDVNPLGQDITKNYQGEEMQFELQVQGFNVFTNGWYRAMKVLYENPFVETVFEDDFTSNTSWRNKWVHTQNNGTFDDLIYDYDVTGATPGYLSIGYYLPTDPDYKIKGQFGFWAAPLETLSLDDMTSYSPSINGYFMPSDPTAYLVNPSTGEFLDSTYLYRAGFLVQYFSFDDTANQRNCPDIRFRTISSDLEQINTVEVSSVASGNTSPNLNEEREYSLLFTPHIDFYQGRLNLAFDMHNFDTTNIHTAIMFLKKVRLDRMELKKLRDWKDIASYDFSTSTQGWMPAEISGNVQCKYEDQALKITSTNNQSSFGFWNSPQDEITLKPNKIYRARYNLESTTLNWTWKAPFRRYALIISRNLRDPSLPFTTEG